jgi:uncharacterized protein (DUF1697 family)
MERYIAFLRGINVGGHRKVTMGQLRECLQVLPIQDLQTYIQSGNMVFTAQIDEEGVLEKGIAEAMFNYFGFEVPVLVRTVGKIAQIFKANPFWDTPGFNAKKAYFVLLHQLPEVDHRGHLAQLDEGSEEVILIGDCVYLYCHKGYGTAKINNNTIEQKLNVSATTRNFNTVQRLLEMAQS